MSRRRRYHRHVPIQRLRSPGTGVQGVRSRCGTLVQIRNTEAATVTRHVQPLRWHLELGPALLAVLHAVVIYKWNVISIVATGRSDVAALLTEATGVWTLLWIGVFSLRTLSLSPHDRLAGAALRVASWLVPLACAAVGMAYLLYQHTHRGLRLDVLAIDPYAPLSIICLFSAMLLGSLHLWLRHRVNSLRLGSSPVCSCGYSLIGNTSGRCPECGCDVIPQAASPRPPAVSEP